MDYDTPFSPSHLSIITGIITIICPRAVPIIRLLSTTLTNLRLDRDKKWHHISFLDLTTKSIV